MSSRPEHLLEEHVCFTAGNNSNHHAFPFEVRAV